MLNVIKVCTSLILLYELLFLHIKTLNKQFNTHIKLVSQLDYVMLIKIPLISRALDQSIC